MSIYYLNNSGNNISPYDTSENGATNFATLNSNITFVNDDIIRFVAEGGIIDDTDINITISNSLTFENYTTTDSMATWELGIVPEILLSEDGSKNIVFRDFKIHFGESSGLHAFLAADTDIDGLTISGCNIESDMDISDPDSTYMILLVGYGGSETTALRNVSITHNKINNLERIYRVFSDYDNIDISNNSIVINSTDPNTNIWMLEHIHGSDSISKNITIHDNYCKGFRVLLRVAGPSSYNISYENLNIYNNEIVDAFTGLVWIDDISIDNCNIYNNKIENSVGFLGGIRIEYTSSFIGGTVNNLNIHNNNISVDIIGIIIPISNSDVVFTNCKVNNNNINITTSNPQTGIQFDVPNCDDVEILNNIIIMGDASSSGSYGILSEGYHLNGTSKNVTIKNNIIKNGNYNGILISNTFDDAENWDISYNNIINNATSASNSEIKIDNTSTNLIKNCDINNNIVYGTGVINIEVKNLDANTSLLDYNNYNVSPNITFNNTISGALSTSGSNNVIGDPRWVDLDDNDYYLKQDSPCIDVGRLGIGDDIGAIDYIEGVNVYIQDSVITNLTNKTSVPVVIRLENNAISSDIRNEFNVILDDENQFDFNPPVNYPLLKDNIGYNENLTWLISNREELAPFPDIDVPPNPGKAYPDYIEYPFGIFGFRRSDSK